MLKKRSFYFVLVLIVIIGIFLATHHNNTASARSITHPKTIPATTQPTQTIIQTLRSDEQGMQFSLVTADIEIEATGNVTIPGLTASIAEAGAPALPLYTTYIALPQEAEATVSVEAGAVTTQYIAAVPPAPQPGIWSDEQLSTMPELENGIRAQVSPVPVSSPDATIYQADALYPPVTYAVSDPMYYRDIRLIKVTLYPVRYNPVTALLHHTRQMVVSITFTGIRTEANRAAPTPNDVYQQSLADIVLNYDQAQQWRSLPSHLYEPPTTPLPTGTDTYKIEVNEDGIYEVSGADLAAAGMSIAAVDPNTIEMMYRGEPVAYQFIGNSDTVLQPEEKIRFYGWAFRGPRTEKQYVTSNVFWLWAGGTPTRITTVANEADMGLPVIQTYLASVTVEPENHFFSTWTDQWDHFPNEPDAWYWDYIRKNTAGLFTRTYQIELPYPTVSGPDATYTLEITSRDNVPLTHIVRGYINSYPSYGEATWYNKRNVNVVNSVPLNQLVAGANEVKLVSATDITPGPETLYLNRITVDYTRQLVASNNQLIFSHEAGGQHEFQVSGFSQGDASQVLVWNLADARQPIQVMMEPGYISDDGGSYTYKIGSDHAAGASFIATTTDNVLTNATISQYIPASLEPSAGQADWLAITHHEFMTETLRLAAHRAEPAYGGLKTHVVDVADVINQYGFGLPLPAAIRDYLAHALANWTVAPSYVVLVGDATLNPRNLDCPLPPTGGCSVWEQHERTFVLTNLVFVDPYQGLVPSDHPFVLLSGDDLLPDMTIGRIAADTAEKAANTINKIIQYETNQFTPTEWQRNVLFVADNDDDAGFFCAANQSTSLYLPESFVQTHLCLPGSATNPPTITQTNQLRDDMSYHINTHGISILNYRGHGSIRGWASPEILSVNRTDFWQNDGKPVVILSADCLDSHFAWPGYPALSETFMELPAVGSVAHWSSTGLGFTVDHTTLHQGFYLALFEEGLTAAGDAANYAKVRYSQQSGHLWEVYTFLLQGDPAMHLFRPDFNLSKQTPKTNVEPGDTVTFTLQISNDSLYPTQPNITDNLPTGLSYVNATSTLPVTTTVAGNNLTFALLTPLAWGDTATIMVTTTVAAEANGVLTNIAAVTSPGFDLNLDNNSDSASVFHFMDVKNYYVPVILGP